MSKSEDGFHQLLKNLVNFNEFHEADKPLIVKGLPFYLYSLFAKLLAESLNSEVHLFYTKQEFEHLEQLLKKFAKELSGQNFSVEVQVGKRFSVELSKLGYTRVQRVWEPGEFSVVGDVITIWESGHDILNRISLIGSDIESIDLIDAVTRKKVGSVNSVLISAESRSSEEEAIFDIVVGRVTDVNVARNLLIIENELKYGDFSEFKDEIIDIGLRQLPFSPVEGWGGKHIHTFIEQYLKLGYKFYALKSILREDHDPFPFINFIDSPSVEKELLSLSRGFIMAEEKAVFLTSFELYGEINLADNLITFENKSEVYIKNSLNKEKNALFKKISPGDYIVHEDHGVGKYAGIIQRDNGDFIKVEYAKNDLLFIPLSQAKKVTKYIGGGRSPLLTTLNGGAWKSVIRKASADAEHMAKELIQLYAMRQNVKISDALAEGISIQDYQRFIDSFQYNDTEDQAVVSAQIVEDLQSGSPMDRLLVGDVGFGKTEVALRAAFAVVNAGFQVAILAPTTILAYQHYTLIKKRFKDYNLKFGLLSRFQKSAEKSSVLEKLASGEINIIVGTHSLLNKAVEFANLGLIIVDEEQKFGVKQKEVLKAKRIDAHILSMSATPIPRTLNMSLSGVKDISIIATPPHGRMSVKNIFAPVDWSKIAEAIEIELARNGQVYFLHNRVTNIQAMRRKISEHFPNKVVEIAHGQMKGEELAFIMQQMAEGAIDILVCTTIIENGIDLPNVNTLIVHEAEMFGLSQLYQLRGRVGRSDKQAYAYFFYSSLKGQSSDRLNALSTAEELGSGYNISSVDLEIRGAGNLLGKEQSGSINSIGYGMYIYLLSEEVEKLKKKIS